MIPAIWVKTYMRKSERSTEKEEPGSGEVNLQQLLRMAEPPMGRTKRVGSTR